MLVPFRYVPEIIRSTSKCLNQEQQICGMHTTNTQHSLPVADTLSIASLFLPNPEAFLETSSTWGFRQLIRLAPGENPESSLVQEVNLRTLTFHNHRYILNTSGFVHLRVTYQRHFTVGPFRSRGSILFELGAEGAVEDC